MGGAYGKWSNWASQAIGLLRPYQRLCQRDGVRHAHLLYLLYQGYTSVRLNCPKKGYTLNLRGKSLYRGPRASTSKPSIVVTPCPGKGPPFGPSKPLPRVRVPPWPGSCLGHRWATAFPDTKGGNEGLALNPKRRNIGWLASRPGEGWE